MENNQIEHDDDEISLIDLGAVLIRYRKLIFIFTAACTILAGLWLFVATPMLNPESRQQQVLLTYTIKCSDMPPAIANIVNGGREQISSAALDYITAPYITSFLHTKNPVLLTTEEIEKMKKIEYNKFITEHILGGANTSKKLGDSENCITFSKGPLNIIFVNMSIPASRRADADSFIALAVQEMNREMDSRFTESIDKKQVDTDAAIERITQGTMSDSGTQALSSLITLSQEFTNFKRETKGYYITYSPDDTFEIIGNGKGRIKKMIIVIFASFFISVFFAFAANAVHSIKEDPEASKKIKDAWEQGK